jgi:hypothetical protein
MGLGREHVLSMSVRLWVLSPTPKKKKKKKKKRKKKEKKRKQESEPMTKAGSSLETVSCRPGWLG